jgi:hypothetical protein
MFAKNGTGVNMIVSVPEEDVSKNLNIKSCGFVFVKYKLHTEQ